MSVKSQGKVWFKKRKGKSHIRFPDRVKIYRLKPSVDGSSNKDHLGSNSSIVFRAVLEDGGNGTRRTCFKGESTHESAQRKCFSYFPLRQEVYSTENSILPEYRRGYLARFWMVYSRVGAESHDDLRVICSSLTIQLLAPTEQRTGWEWGELLPHTEAR